MSALDKKQLARALQLRLEQSLESLKASQQAAQAAAVHPDARQEHSKDMRATEASYIARGLAERYEKLRDDILSVERMPVRALDEHEPAASGAVVTVVDADGVERAYLLAPAGGGERLVAEGRAVLVLTLKSPLGTVLAGCRRGEVVFAELPSGRCELEVTRIE